MIASFTVIPMGIGEELKETIAQTLSIVDKSGLKYTLGAMQTTLEGERNSVMNVILQCHEQLLKLCPRVLTTITIDERKGFDNRLTGKIKDVEQVLGRKLQHE